MRVPEGYTYELLVGNLIKPVSEGAIRAAEAESVLSHGFLVVLAVIWCCRPRLMHEMRERVLSATFPCVYCGHRTAVLNFVSLILSRYNVEGHYLEVKETLATTLYITSVRGLIRTICFVLHL